MLEKASAAIDDTGRSSMEKVADKIRNALKGGDDVKKPKKSEVKAVEAKKEEKKDSKST